MKFSFIYVTVTDKSEAMNIGKILVEEKLAACVNVFSPMTSLYEWEGQIQESNEAVLIVKTKKDLVQDVIQKIKSLHSYECPCIVELSIERGNEEFLKWVGDQTL